MLALIIFSFLIGFACLNSGGKDFSRFLHSGNEVMKQLLHIIMKTAPVGLGAYFAYQVGIFGPTAVWSIHKTIRIVLCGLCFLFCSVL
jgi:Na+/H+-dicarboxylate symporter